MFGLAVGAWTDARRWIPLPRLSGCGLLADVLVACGPVLALPPVGIKALADFFTSRLADSACLPDIVRALHTVVTTQPLPTAGQAVSICRALFTRVQVPALTQVSRKFALETTLHLLTHYEAGASRGSTCA